MVKILSMNSKEDKPAPADPENVVRMLELELMRERANRQGAGKPYGGLRAASFIFLFVVILVGLLAFYYLYSSGRLDEMRTRNIAPTPDASAVPSTP